MAGVALTLFNLAAFEVSNGPVRLGEWNSDFPAVLAEAQKEHRPLLLIHTSQGCPLCARLNKAIDGEAFRQWQKDRNLLMAYVRTGGKDAVYKRTHDFVKSFADDLPGFPFVCIYWPREDGSTNRVAFSGRRGGMGEEKNKLFSIELMTALDHALKDYLETAKCKTIEQILKDSTKIIGGRAEGSGGTVTVRPEDGRLPEGGSVSLDAVPASESLFVCWKDPAGKAIGFKPHLEVSGGMSAGNYTAHFRAKATCPSPVLETVSTSLCVRVGQKVDYKVVVDEKYWPVRFKPKRIPSGIKLDIWTGVISGKMKRVGKHSFSVMVIGSDLAKTVISQEITLTAVSAKTEADRP